MNINNIMEERDVFFVAQKVTFKLQGSYFPGMDMILAEFLHYFEIFLAVMRRNVSLSKIITNGLRYLISCN